MHGGQGAIANIYCIVRAVIIMPTQVAVIKKKVCLMAVSERGYFIAGMCSPCRRLGVFFA
ncbi:MAG: hypothetical protein ACI9Y1_000181 [Lentisphaeria bacterium]|jgi:hypothetical protein